MILPAPREEEEMSKEKEITYKVTRIQISLCFSKSTFDARRIIDLNFSTQINY